MKKFHKHRVLIFLIVLIALTVLLSVSCNKTTTEKAENISVSGG